MKDRGSQHDSLCLTEDTIYPFPLYRRSFIWFDGVCLFLTFAINGCARSTASKLGSGCVDNAYCTPGTLSRVSCATLHVLQPPIPVHRVFFPALKNVCAAECSICLAISLAGMCVKNARDAGWRHLWPPTQ